MTIRPEMAPAALPARPFPIGDVLPIPATRSIDFLAKVVDSETDNHGRSRLRWMRDVHYEDWANQPRQAPNIAAIQRMATPWDMELISDNELPVRIHFQRAFRTSIGFIHRTKLIPLDFGDFSAELTEISTYPMQDIAIMVGELEASMRSHPKCNVVLQELLRAYTTLNYISPDDKNTTVAVKYGMFLPYALSSISRLQLQPANRCGVEPDAIYSVPIYSACDYVENTWTNTADTRLVLRRPQILILYRCML